MKNFLTKKRDGFTLIELIVVMAIVGVLAAIMVPTIIGFMKDAKITSANQDAKTVYTAATSWLANISKSQDLSTYAGSVYSATGIPADSSPIECTSSTSPKTSDLRDYLGSNIRGNITFICSSSGSSISFCLYSKDSTLPTGTVQLSKNAQKSFTSSVVGCYPLAS